MTTVGRDNATQGNWRGAYGAQGFQFYHYCASAPGGGGSASVSTTCASVKETQTATLSCAGGANDAIKSITFADFGTPSGACASSSGSGNFAHDSTCTTANFAAVVAAPAIRPHPSHGGGSEPAGGESSALTRISLPLSESVRLTLIPEQRVFGEAALFAGEKVGPSGTFVFHVPFFVSFFYWSSASDARIDITSRRRRRNNDSKQAQL